MTSRYLEDWTEGEVFETRGLSMTESAIHDYALRFDPQPMHLDMAFAKDGEFGGLIASGFHTLALAFRSFIDTGYFLHSNIIGLGLDELRWTAPVRPGDTLRCRVEVLEVRPSGSKPDRGIVRLAYTVLNQDNAPVMSFRSASMVRRRAEIGAG